MTSSNNHNHPDADHDAFEGVATREQIDAAVVHVLTKILGCSAAEVLADQRRYAAFQQDDSTYDDELSVDWSTLTLRSEDEEDEEDEDGEDIDEDEADEEDEEDDEGEEDEDDTGNAFLYGRRDFDIARSFFDHEDFGPRARSDKSLRRFLAATGGSLTGSQFGEAVTSGRIDASIVADIMLLGRIRARSESLIDTARALFMLDGARAPMRPASYSKVERTWKQHLASVEPQALRVHLGCFFLTVDSARCDGACFEGARDEHEDDDDEGASIEEQGQLVGKWGIGEGQGHFELTRILAEPTVTLPAFEGHVLLRKRPRSRVVRPLAELTANLTSLPIPRRLSRLWSEKSLRTVKQLVDAIASEGVEAVFAPMREADLADRTRTVVGAIQALLERDGPELAYALGTAALPFVTDGIKALFFYNQGVALNAMGEFAAARTAIEAAFEASRNSVEGAEVPPSYLQNNLAWYRYQTGDAAGADVHAREAMREDPENINAIGTAAHIAFALGREQEALELFRLAMVGNNDPEPTSAMLTASPALLALVIENGLAVSIDDDLAAKLGPEAWVFVGDEDDEDEDEDEDDEDEDDEDGDDEDGDDEDDEDED